MNKLRCGYLLDWEEGCGPTTILLVRAAAAAAAAPFASPNLWSTETATVPTRQPIPISTSVIHIINIIK